MKILVTGAAGFIGYKVSKYLASKNYNVFGIDIVQDMFEVHSKYLRLNDLGFLPKNIMSGKICKSSKFQNLTFQKIDITDLDAVNSVFQNNNFDYVLHFASREGLRNSLTKPAQTAAVNITGFVNVIEASKKNNIKHFVYAGSGAVYGLSVKSSYSAKDNAGHPISLSDATKRSNELIAHSYSYMFRLPTTGLRFFPLYGTFDRPDSLVFMLCKSVDKGNPVNITNSGENLTDITYIDDILELIEQIMLNKPESRPYFNDIELDFSKSSAPFRIYNISSGRPVSFNNLISAVEAAFEKTAERVDVQEQFSYSTVNRADVSDILSQFPLKKHTSTETGIKIFVDWYKQFFGNNSV